MHKHFAMLLSIIGLKVAAIATSACFLIIIDEPQMPDSMIKK